MNRFERKYPGYKKVSIEEATTAYDKYSYKVIGFREKGHKRLYKFARHSKKPGSNKYDRDYYYWYVSLRYSTGIYRVFFP
jgi:hypothetical protein